MEFRLLGPLEVAESGQALSLGGSRARALLALLLLHRNEVVAVDRIVDALWECPPPKSAEQIVRVYVSNLRKTLEASGKDGPPQVLVTHGSGYMLRIDSAQVDVDRFDALRTEGRRLLEAGDVSRAADTLGEALSLWRGPSLQDFAYERFAQAEIARLEELRLETLEERFDAELAAGRSSELVADLERLVEANPLRERARAQLMLALYRSGRQADALDTYRRGRRLFAAELGLEPGEALRQLETRILQQDPGLARPGAPQPPPKTPDTSRRSRRLPVIAIAVAVVGLALVAGVLVVATSDRGRGRSTVEASRVTLVESAPRGQSDTSLARPDLVNALRTKTEELHLRMKVRYVGIDPPSLLRAVAAAARSSDLVIVGATPYLQKLSRLTQRFPDTRFLVPDSVHDKKASFAGQRNVTGSNFDDRENAYIGGYLAGLMTHGRRATVSAVGGKRTKSVRDLIAGFSAGARHARPGIRVLFAYSRTFVDQARCEALANQQIRRNSAVVFDAAGSCGQGALQAAIVRGVWGLGVDTDLSYLGPQILASVVKRFDRAEQLGVALFASGRLPRGQDLRLDLTSDSIGLEGISTSVPKLVRAKVEALDAKLRAHDETRDERRAALR